MQNEPWLDHYDSNVPTYLNYDPISVVDLFSHQAANHPNEIMLIDGEKVFTYQQIDQFSNQVCNGLAAIGCKFDEPIGLMMPNIPQFVISFIGILKFGGVVTALNPTYSARELKYHLSDAGIKTVIAIQSLNEVFINLALDIRLNHIVYTSENELIQNDFEFVELMIPKSSENLALTFQQLLELGRQDQKVSHPSMDSRAILQYSGGTTGTPKAAIGTHRNLIANMTQFSTWLSGMEDPHQPILAAIPLFHVYGMVLCMLLSIKMNVPLVLVHSARDITGIFKAIKIYRPGIFPSVPTQINGLLSHPELINYVDAFRSIQVCISGSAPLRVDVKEKFEKLLGGVLVEGFGMSEAPTATHCNPIKGVNKPGSIGLPLPDVTCKIVEPGNDEQIKHICDAGELLIRGPQIMQGYLNHDQETQEILRDGWLHTGDIAVMDEEGYFYIIGRQKDLIKVGGLQVWPQEIEEVVNLIDGVKESAAAGVADEHSGEKPIVWIVVKEQAIIDEERVRAFCRQNLASYKVPAEVIFVPNLPRTTVGKLLRRELIADYLDQGNHQPA